MSAGMPHRPLGGGCMAAPISPWPSPIMSMKALRSSASMIARRSSGLSNGGTARLMIAVRLAGHLPCLVFDLLQQRYRHEARSGTIELVGAEGQDPSRGVANDCVLYAVEIRPA